MFRHSGAKAKSEVEGKPLDQANLPLEPSSESRLPEDHADPGLEQPDWQVERRSARMWRVMFRAAIVFWIGVGIILLVRSFGF